MGSDECLTLRTSEAVLQLATLAVSAPRAVDLACDVRVLSCGVPNKI